jgi:CRISPR-associated endonuclease/helicase Cas3
MRIFVVFEIAKRFQKLQIPLKGMFFNIMQSQTNKAARLEQIEQLLLRHKDGLTISEIARKIGVNRSTVWHYYYDADLPHSHYELCGDGRIRLNPERLHFNIKLNLDEALALHLAARLFSTRMDRHNPAAASAIRKISSALETMAPPLSRAMSQAADRADGDDQLQDPRYIEILKTLSKAWANGRMARILYASERSGQEHEYIFSPYFIEPYAIGQTTYVIGQIGKEEGMRTFKIERIHQAELLADSYVIPPDFDADDFLKDAWGIWTTGRPPVEVVLRFSPRVAQRVKETRWHRSQKLEDLEDGSVLWRAWIAEPKEMEPWIKGWGDEVVVLSNGSQGL